MVTAVAAPLAAGPKLHVARLPVLSDNYVWLLEDASSGVTAVVDPAEAEPVMQALEAKGKTLDFILNTHHHGDHVGGNMTLKRKYGCKIIGPKADAKRIPGLDIPLADGDSTQVGNLELRCFDTPGHTRGHIVLWMPEAKSVFVGDTLFALGCGRLFEGSPEQMWDSLSKLKAALPPDTVVYCAHEYTQSNARFALTVDPANHALKSRAAAIDAARKVGEPTVPSTFREELATNPFLRPDDAGLRAAMGFDASAPDAKVFAAVRAAKDSF